MDFEPGKKITISAFFVFVLISILLLPNIVLASGISVANTCNPVAEVSCGLPFPSDLFLNTSGKLNYSDNIFDREVGGQLRDSEFSVKSQFPVGFRPSQIFNDSEGFSALGPVLFELSEWPQEEILRSGDGQLLVFDRDSGEIVPMIVTLSSVANPEREFRQKSPVVIAWPRARFEFSGRYVAVLLRDQLHTRSSGGEEVFDPSEGMKKILDGSGSFFVKNAYAPILDTIDEAGIDRNNIISLTYFTVRPESEVTTPIPLMIQRALGQSGFVQNLHQRSSLDTSEDALMTLAGDLSLINFRRVDGGIYPPYTPQPDSSLDHTDFILTLPKVPENEDVPLMLWGHGLANFKDYKHSGYRRAGRLGIATLAIDHPNHGKRVTVDPRKSPSIALAVRSPLNMMHLLGMFVQTVIDHAVVARMAHDLLPEKLAELKLQKPEIPSIDITKMYYQGLSLGGMVGPTIGVTAPYIEGAYVVNGASSLMQLFSESAMWDGNTSMVIPANATGAEATLVLAMMQHYIDIADGSNFAHWYQNPPVGNFTKKLGMLYALGDGSVVNDTSLALAEIADLPLLKTVIEPVFQLRDGEEGRDGYENGNGVAQTGYGLDLAENAVDELKAFDPNRVTNLEGLSVFGNLSGLDFGDSILADSLESLLASAGSESEVDSFEELVDIVYDGDLESFLTHFNRSSVEAVGYNIDWVCGVVNVTTERCAYAKVKAEEDAENSDLIDDEVDPSDLEDLLGVGALGTIEVKVVDGTGGSTNPIGIALISAFLLWRKRFSKDFMRRAKKALMLPFVRTTISAILSAATWFLWALWVNWGQGDNAWSSGFAQGVSSFCTTFTGSWLMEWLFVRLGGEPLACALNVIIVSSCSLLFMVFMHEVADTQRVFITVFPIFNVVIAFCTAYVWGLRRLNTEITAVE